MHGSHVVGAPKDSSANLPATQTRQTLLPSKADTDPEAHGVHALAAAAPENLPGLHREQVVVAMLAAKVPGAQSVQVLRPEVPEYLPTGHGV